VLLLENKVGEMEKKVMEDKQRQLEREIDQLKAKPSAPAQTPIIVNNNNNNTNYPTYQPPMTVTRVVTQNVVVMSQENKDGQIICTMLVLSFCFGWLSLCCLICMWPQVTNKKNVLIYGNIINFLMLIVYIILIAKA